MRFASVVPSIDLVVDQCRYGSLRAQDTYYEVVTNPVTLISTDSQRTVIVTSWHVGRLQEIDDWT